MFFSEFLGSVPLFFVPLISSFLDIQPSLRLVFFRCFGVSSKILSSQNFQFPRFSGMSGNPAWGLCRRVTPAGGSQSALRSTCCCTWHDIVVFVALAMKSCSSRESNPSWGDGKTLQTVPWRLSFLGTRGQDVTVIAILARKFFFSFLCMSRKRITWWEAEYFFM